MKALFTLFALLITSQAFGQESCPELWTACGEGTIWDEESQKCIVANVSDTDFDECVGTSDFLIHLANFGSGCSPESLWDCGDSLAYQGYLYETVLIGEQCWFAENLRSENYENGDVIASGLSGNEWSSTTSGAVSVYGGGDDSCYDGSPDGDACDVTWSLNEYGRLYNWYAVDDERGLCPIGWHVPTDGEWTVTTDVLGGINIAGYEMKSTYGWYMSGNGNNASGFNGFPGGFRDDNGSFGGSGDWGHWWTSSYSFSNAWSRDISSDDESINKDSADRGSGRSVRCIQDAE